MQATRFYCRFSAAAAALALIAGSSSCGHSSGTRPGAAVPTSPAAPPPQRKTQIPLEVPDAPSSADLGEFMSAHFMITSWARDAVIAGVIDALQEPLTLLADYRYDDLHHAEWKPWLAQLQAAARLTSSATSLDSAAMGVASMARVCGECHLANHRGPTFATMANPDPADPVAADTVPERMGRHLWAAELLWDGITGPSETAWKEGLTALTEAPAQLDAELPADFDAALRDIRSLGQDARDATTLAQRADVFGLLIATCAECHSRWLEVR